MSSKTNKTAKAGAQAGAQGDTRSARSIDPLILAGGAAIVGAAAGALIPRSAAEKRALAPVGVLVSDAATAALHRARAGVSAQVAALPVVGPSAAAQLDQAIDAVTGPTQAPTAV